MLELSMRFGITPVVKLRRFQDESTEVTECLAESARRS